jgi:hypothetical protein
MAALSEARRLTGMVLANNGTFGLWQSALTAGDELIASQYETELSGDKVFQAYRQLGAALAEIEPRVTASDAGEGCVVVRLAERVSLLPVAGMGRFRSGVEPCAACANGSPNAVVCCGDSTGDREAVAEFDAAAMTAEASLGARLNKVLEMTAMADTQVVAPVWAVPRDEARVSIVYKDGPGVPVTACDAQRPGLVTLFR